MTKPLFKFLLPALLLFSAGAYSQNDNFKVVLDPGHGGQDPGTIHHGFVEKEVALKVALKVGEMLDKDSKMDIIFTRRTDVFIGLKERAQLANKAKADLFVSIHCNGVNNTAPSGTETFVMGLSRSNTNLEIAKRENNVIVYEDDYKVKYKGFNPNNPETLLGLELMQDHNRDQSIELAVKIQEGFKKVNRGDRGVKQIPLWVLDATVMPGVLVELGFLSNKEEGEYLTSEAGQIEMARSIANAIIEYRNELRGIGSAPVAGTTPSLPKQEPVAVPKEVPVTVPVVEAAPISAGEDAIEYKVQISAGNKDLKLMPSNFKGLNNVSKIKDGSLYKYYYGATADYTETQQLLKEAKAKGYSSAFVVAFSGGRKIDVEEARKKQHR